MIKTCGKFCMQIYHLSGLNYPNEYNCSVIKNITFLVKIRCKSFNQVLISKRAYTYKQCLKKLIYKRH